MTTGGILLSVGSATNMRIKILGKTTKLSKKESRFATQYFAKLLLSDKLNKTIDLTIKFTKLGKNHPGAECGWEDNNIRPKEFEIVIDNTWGRRSQLLSLAHEMVHLKQYAKGELVDYTSWKMLRYSKWKNTKIVNEDNTYWDHPWEIEAYGRELGLYTKYKFYLTTINKKF